MKPIYISHLPDKLSSRSTSQSQRIPCCHSWLHKAWNTNHKCKLIAFERITKKYILLEWRAAADDLVGEETREDCSEELPRPAMVDGVANVAAIFGLTDDDARRMGVEWWENVNGVGFCCMRWKILWKRKTRMDGFWFNEIMTRWNCVDRVGLNLLSITKVDDGLNCINQQVLFWLIDFWIL